MSSHEIHKVPVIRILVNSILLPWRNKAKYLKALALPTLVLVVIFTFLTIFSENFDEISSWLVWPFYVVGFSIFSVTCHRLILADSKLNSFSISLSKRELKFAVWVVVLYLVNHLILLASVTVIINLPLVSSLDLNDSNGIYFVSLIASIPALYILARFCLVFPSTAIDKSTQLKWSWERTRNNGWRIAVIVGLYPWLLSLSLWLFLREETSISEQVIIALLYYFGCAIEIFALSLTYKEIMRVQSDTADNV